MSNLIAVAFEDQATAFELRAELVKLQTEYLIEMEDAVVVTRDADGKVKLHQAVNMTAAGAVGGSFWGLLIGLIFFNPLLGAAVGAGAGALTGGLSDIGIKDDFMRGLAEKLPKGGSALFILMRKSTPDKLVERLHAFRGKGHILQTSLTNVGEADLRALFEGANSSAAA